MRACVCERAQPQRNAGRRAALNLRVLILEATTLGELLISCSCLVRRGLAYFMSSPLNPAAFLCGGRQHLTFAPTATNITKDLLPVFAVVESAVIYEVGVVRKIKGKLPRRKSRYSRLSLLMCIFQFLQLQPR